MLAKLANIECSSLFSDTSNIRRAGMTPNSSGNAPVKLFWCKYRASKNFRLPKVDGIAPVKLLKCKPKRRSYGNSVKRRLIVPLKRALGRFILVTWLVTLSQTIPPHLQRNSSKKFQLRSTLPGSRTLFRKPASANPSELRAAQKGRRPRRKNFTATIAALSLGLRSMVSFLSLDCCHSQHLLLPLPHLHHVHK